jgi:endonuclease YncB( thermonuclease family)
MGRLHLDSCAMKPTDLARRQRCHRLGKGLLTLVSAFAILTFPVPDLWAGKSTHSGKYQSFRGARAIDGDTFFYRGKRYRIQQYNAPELNEPGGPQAKKVLQQKIASGDYAWKPVARDKYGRTIVREKKR